MILHIVNKSSFNSKAFSSAINSASDGDSILLIEDGVYTVNTLAESPLKQKANSKSLNLYCLSEDMQARGITLDNASVTVTNYSGFVDLVEQHKSSCTWN